MSLYDTNLVFFVMVFIAVFLLAQSVVVRSRDQKTIQRMRRRIKDVSDAYRDSPALSLLKERYRGEQTALERGLSGLPGMGKLMLMVEQSGRGYREAYRILLFSLVLAVVGGLVAWLLFGRDPWMALLAAAFAGYLPFFKVSRDRNRRLERFEEQLPEALDFITRALRVGYPFNEALKAISEEMEDPVRKEFEITFNDINYGLDVRIAFLNLLERVPSTNLLSLVTGVLIQRESGGNLTEILEKISKVIRQRFRFQRRVLTLSAEARLSAWLVSLMPFVMVLAFHILDPNYLPMLTKHPSGMTIILFTFCLMVLGILWIQRLLKKVMEI